MNVEPTSMAGAVATMPAEKGSASDPLDLIWGIAGIAEVIGKSPKATYYMLENGDLPARQVKKRWVASRQKLREFFEGAA